MTDVIRASKPEDLLALLPTLLGYQPKDSLVLVMFAGNRTAGALRLDSAVLGAPGSASSMLGLVARVDVADGIVPVLYADGRFAGDQTTEFRSQLFSFCDLADSSGYQVRDALIVCEDGWGSLLDPDTPTNGFPWEMVTSSPVNAIAPAPAVAVDADAVLPAASDAERAAVASALKLVNVDGVTSDVVTGSLDGMPDPVRAANLLVLFQQPAHRDVTLLRWAFGDDVGALADRDRQEYAETGSVSDDSFGELFRGIGPRPDPHRVDAATRLCLRLAALAPDGLDAAPLAMAGWLLWALGKSSAAAVVVHRSMAAAPGFTFPRLLDVMIERQHIPEWAFAVTLPDDGELNHLN